MKWTFFIIILILLGVRVNANNLKPLQLQHLTDNFYIFTTYKNLDGYWYPANGMYMITNEGAVLFDTPWDSTQWQPLLDSILARHHVPVVMAIATHYHNDRTGGFEYYNNKQIKTFSSAHTLKLCKQFNEKTASNTFLKDTSFNIGNIHFETFYPGPGHTQDNIVIWFPTQKILYGGCLIKSTENNSLGNIADADLKQWPESLKKLLQRYNNIQFIIPGHYDWRNKNSIKHTLKLLRKK